ncbi:unnamed protein product [Lactuca saligna]|uniref:Uncharacterized protein n=1 Tax=Lactuca saligna TaxID=75948 RepID=A0AA36A3B2_LACSI|nr:unnamed protein product [Lactuca saligna]
MPPKIEFGSSSDNPKITPDNPNVALNDQLEVLIHLVTATNNRLDTITTHLVAQSNTMNNIVKLLTANNNNNQVQPPLMPPPPPPNAHPRPPKIYLPNFDGSNSLDWVFQAENYFTYYAIPPNQRLALSVFYFTGDALSGYKHITNKNLLGRTCPSRPQTLHQTYGLTKLIEDKLRAQLSSSEDSIESPLTKPPLFPTLHHVTSRYSEFRSKFLQSQVLVIILLTRSKFHADRLNWSKIFT